MKHKSLLSPHYASMMDVIGFDGMCAWTDNFNGTTQYIPSTRSLFMPCIEAEVKASFDGFNYRDLARKFGFCERTVRKIIERN